MEREESPWLLRLLYNVLGYATVAVPMALVVWYIRKHQLYQSESDPRRWYVRFSRLLVYGRLDYERPSLELGGCGGVERPAADKPRSIVHRAVVLGFCFLGLQVSYLTWGVLQEKIMTQKYYAAASEVGQSFRDSQFLVFVNRVLAFAFAAVYLAASTKQPPHSAPFYKYFYCSFSNILSSWFQYEALKFVAFPTQVLAKASKIIPVMLMGKVVSRKSYHSYEYVVAVTISLGMSMFLWSRPDSGPAGAAGAAGAGGGGGAGKSYVESTSFSGAVILAAYMVTDSFTSNWQGELFSKFRMSSIQMMCGVNFFSTLLTFVSLLQQGALFASLSFAMAHHAFAYDCVLLSICSATGQLFVFYTISQFGPVTFVIMMTIRQAVAILLSCIIYRHSMSLLGAAGITVIFSAVFFKVWCGQRRKRKPTSASSASTPKVAVSAAMSPDHKRLLSPRKEVV